MLSDLTLIKLFLSSREIYDKYSPYVRLGALGLQARTILQDLKAYYSVYPDAVVNMEQFVSWFRQIQHPEFSETKAQLYGAMFELVEQEPISLDDTFIATIIHHFKRKDFEARIKTHLEKPEGWEPDTILELVKKYTEEADISQGEDYDTDDIFAMLKKEDRSGGLQWRLKCLQRACGPIILTDFIIVGAYANTGKTSFCVSEVSHMAQQLTEGTILWFTNEQTTAEMKLRVMCATLQTTQREIAENPLEAKEAYTQLMHGDYHRIKFVNLPGTFKMKDIKRVATRYKPRLIVVDMIDKLIHGKVEARDDIRLQRMYQDLREIAKTIAPVLGTSQASGDATYVKEGQVDFVKYLGMHQLAGTRVGKQGEAELLITIGRDENMPMTRFIHTPKNNLPGDGSAKRQVKCEVTFNENLSLYTD